MVKRCIHIAESIGPIPIPPTKIKTTLFSQSSSVALAFAEQAQIYNSDHNKKDKK